MENAEKALEEFDKYFNLTSDNDDTGQAEEYARITELDDDFDRLSDDMSEIIGLSNEKGHALPIVEPVEEKITVESVEEKITVKPVEEKITVEPVEEKQADIPVPTRSSAKHFHHKYGDEIEEHCQVQMGSKKATFFLDPPSSLYDNFYARKRELVFTCTPGGQLDFDVLSTELEDASVDIVSETFDQEETRKKMELVQQYRDRVKNISIRTNNQYFIWKRWVPLLEGSLAKVQYLKPQIKQDGLVLEHMSDLWLYFSRLESLHNNVVNVEKNLAAAFETLSRKVSICMELKPTERYERQGRREYSSKFSDSTPTEENKPKIKSSDLDDYDELPINAEIKQKPKSGQVNWSDI